MSTEAGKTARTIVAAFLVKRQAWCLTWKAWCVLVMFVISVILITVRYCGVFLTFNEPVSASVLIVEGWLPDYALSDAAKEFHDRNYKYIITAGSPLLSGYYHAGAKTSAHLAAESLNVFGVSSNLVIPVPAPKVLRGRSLAHARAVGDWVRRHDPRLEAVNVYSIGVHARRTRLLFEQVLGPQIQVGCIAHPDASYDVNRWWTSSEGVKTVLVEAFGFLWCKLFGEGD